MGETMTLVCRICTKLYDIEVTRADLNVDPEHGRSLTVCPRCLWIGLIAAVFGFFALAAWAPWGE